MFLFSKIQFMVRLGYNRSGKEHSDNHGSFVRFSQTWQEYVLLCCLSQWFSNCAQPVPPQKIYGHPYD